MLERHVLRPVSNDDHKFLVELHNDPVVLRNITNPSEITLEQHLQWWEKISVNEKQKRLIYTVNDVRVGFTKFYDIDFQNHNCMLGADIHSSFRGKGYAKHMWGLMLNICFDDLKLHRVSLTTAEFNVIAQQIYYRLGFKKEGLLKQSLYRDEKYYDQICMYMLRSDWIQV